MGQIIIPPQPIPNVGFKVFVGGAIDMGQAIDWQSQVVERLHNEPGLTLLNPRRSDFTQAELDEQITWELNAMEKSDVILMWFPAESEAPISLLEAGLHMKSGKMILGVENGYYRKRNLELTSLYYHVSISQTLDDLIVETIHRHKLWVDHNTMNETQQ